MAGRRREVESERAKPLRTRNDNYRRSSRGRLTAALFVLVVPLASAYIWSEYEWYSIHLVLLGGRRVHPDRALEDLKYWTNLNFHVSIPTSAEVVHAGTLHRSEYWIELRLPKEDAEKLLESLVKATVSLSDWKAQQRTVAIPLLGSNIQPLWWPS